MSAPRTTSPQAADQRGVTLIELVVALSIIAIGVLALAQLMPAGARGQSRDRLRTQASNYAQQEVEDLNARGVTDAAMSTGRHPATGADTLGTLRSYRRFYTVTQMASPLDNLYKVAVSVTWSSARPETINATTYMRQ